MILIPNLSVNFNLTLTGSLLITAFFTLMKFILYKNILLLLSHLILGQTILLLDRQKKVFLVSVFSLQFYIRY